MLLVTLLCIFDEVEAPDPPFGLAEFELPMTIRLSTTWPDKQAKESQLLKKKLEGKVNFMQLHMFPMSLTGRMGKADFIEWIKADFREWSKADSTYAASQQTLFIVSGSPSNLILGEVT